MATHLARHVRQRRLEQQLNLGQLSKACGYINVSKGINRLKAFEQTGKIHRDLLDKLATALGIDDQTIKRLHDEDFREWEKWVDEPIKPYLVVRYVACMYAPWELPTDVRTQADAEKHASDTARKYRLQVALVWSRRLTVFFDQQGERWMVSEATPGEANTPWVQIGHTRIVY